MKKLFIIAAIVFFTDFYVAAQDACRKQMFQIGLNMGYNGYTCNYEEYNYLNSDYYRDHQIYFFAGVNYSICAVCNSDCNDIDIKVYDSFGNLITKDTTDDDIPVVEISVYRAGFFKVQVSMIDCCNDPCTYGLSVFGK